MCDGLKRKQIEWSSDCLFVLWTHLNSVPGWIDRPDEHKWPRQEDQRSRHQYIIEHYRKNYEYFIVITMTYPPISIRIPSLSLKWWDVLAAVLCGRRRRNDPILCEMGC